MKKNINQLRIGSTLNSSHVYLKIRQHYMIYHKVIVIFFTKPGRKGISFQTLLSKISIVEDINNILPITNEISFCSLSVNSLLNSYELVLFSLIRVTGYNINVVNYQLLEDIATTLCEDSDNTFCHSDVISYVTNSDDIFSYRYIMFYEYCEVLLSL